MLWFPLHTSASVLFVLGALVGERSEQRRGWASEASGRGVLPSAARLPPVGLASSRRRRRIASIDINFMHKKSMSLNLASPYQPLFPNFYIQTF